MNTSRRSKIARFPREIRDQLNHRLDDGQPAATILVWLNALPAVRTILQELFGGLPVNEPNLSDWKKSGYRDWLRLQQSCQLAERLADQSEILKDHPEGGQLADRFASLLALEFSRLADDLLADGDISPADRLDHLAKVHREFSRLRRDDQRAIWTDLKRQECARKQAEANREKQRQAAEERRQKLLAPMHARLQFNPLAEQMGGGDWSHAAAAYILEARHDLPLGHFGYQNPLHVRYKPHYDPDELKLHPPEVPTAPLPTAGES